jgi:hypothetical protein
MRKRAAINGTNLPAVHLKRFAFIVLLGIVAGVAASAGYAEDLPTTIGAHRGANI